MEEGEITLYNKTMGELFGIKYDDSEEKKPKPPLVSRRTFLSSAAGAVTAATVGLGGPSAVDKTKDTFLTKELSEEIQKKVSFIKEMYGIEVKSKFNDLKKLMQKVQFFIGQDISGVDEKNSLSKYNRALDYIINGFSKYPTEFVKRMGIKSIFIANNLLIGGGKKEGITTIEESEMYIEISAGPLNKNRTFGWNEKKPFNKTFDHEFFHILDLHFLSDQQRLVWIYLNKKDAFNKYVPNKEGFVDGHAQKSTLEDRASLFSAMTNNSGNIWERCQKDKILNNKVLFLQRMMFSNTFGLINQEYWDLLKKGSLPVDFFQKRRAYLLSLDFDKFKQELELNNWRHFTDEENIAGKEKEIWELYKKRLTEMKL